MASCEHFGIRFTAGAEGDAPANENLELLTGCGMTPAEVLQWARRRKERLIRELAGDARLWSCPEHRRTWDATLGIEKLTLRQCYGVRDA